MRMIGDSNCMARVGVRVSLFADIIIVHRNLSGVSTPWGTLESG